MILYSSSIIWIMEPADKNCTVNFIQTFFDVYYYLYIYYEEILAHSHIFLRLHRYKD